MVTRRRRVPNSKDRLRKAQLSFYPEPEDYAMLKALSARTGVPQQVYLRRGLQYVLQLALRSRVSTVHRRASRLRRDFAELTLKWQQLRRGAR
jgi:histidinol-phosphate/aromatic aminotransferase/cobyric acid decarboxylase-like protein